MIDRDTGWTFMPTSIKGVVFDGEKVLLCLNDRGEWELPGGWPESSDADLAATLMREVREEAGLDVEVGELLLADLLNVGGSTVVIVAFAATVTGGDRHSPQASDEHSRVAFFAVDALPEPLPEVYRRAIALAVAPAPG